MKVNEVSKKDKKVSVSHLGSSEKTVLIEMMQEKINLLEEKHNRLLSRYKLLEDRLAKNSSNSSKPPSSDNGQMKKKKGQKKTTSLRKKSGKKPGGQPGHPGSHLKMSDSPDEIIQLTVEECGNCQRSLKRANCDIEKRQLFEIPEPKLFVSEYQAEHKYCKGCGHTTSACFPDGLTHKTQYGPRAKGLMVYMNEYQMIPFARVSEFFHTIYHHKVSAGTVVNAVKHLSDRLETVEDQIKQLLSKASLANCDETGVNISGNKQWIHTVGNDRLTHFAIHAKRGRKATEAIGILPKFKGIMVHDHWKSYFTYKDSQHALCNAHHLRELCFLYEQQGIKWAAHMSDFLIDVNKRKEHSIAAGREEFSAYMLKKYNASYDDIITKAQREQARRGTIDSHNLLKRLKEYKIETLRFMHDFNVPFTNNQSERDLRMNKVKQKISGCYRSTTGGHDSCRIRTLLSTAKKNKKNIFNSIVSAFENIITVNDVLVDTG